MLSLGMAKFQRPRFAKLSILVGAPALASLILLALGCSSKAMDVEGAPDASAMDGARETRADGSTRWPPNDLDAGLTTDAPAMPTDAGDMREDLQVAGGDVQGQWCGNIDVQDSVVIPSGQTLFVCEGTSISVAEGARIRIDGTLELRGTARQPIRIEGQDWLGLVTNGTLQGTFAEVRGAGVCVKGNDGGEIALHDSYLHDCGQTLSAVNGAHMDRSILEGGSSVSMMGGTLKMTDSVIDLMHDTAAPDCTRLSNASVELSHVHFTGCHCPLHFDSGGATDIIVEDSVFDGATYPAMVAKVRGRFTRNHFSGTAADFLDIGGSIDLDIADNYFGGNAPKISGGPVEQFKNREKFLSEPVAGVGPR